MEDAVEGGVAATIAYAMTLATEAKVPEQDAANELARVTGDHDVLAAALDRLTEDIAIGEHATDDVAFRTIALVRRALDNRPPAGPAVEGPAD